jgi:predicted dehydrogenase/threonine dehydrogenase-like Zn-dependent dehydrogenase
MKQLLQRYDTGEMRLADVPVPGATGVQLLVETRASLISAGTERSIVEVSRAGLVEKARKRPDQVRQVLDKVRTDGVAATLESVQSKLREPFPLGYCSAGVVVQTGSRVHGFAAGDRVVTNGPHSEYVLVPHTLAARIPPGVSFEHAAFTPVAAIALQGIRLAAPTLGETVVVYGLGLIGLLAVQLLRANGCRVIGIDRDAARLALAGRFGATVIHGGEADAVGRVLAETGQVGADAVLLTLAASSDEPVHEAAAMSRRRGRLVLVGVTGLSLRRDDFYRKELSFAVSCSYGPGRYDPFYEDEGHDYPIGFVRWTEQRNFEAVLALMETGALDPAPLVTHRFAFERAHEAYDVITKGSGSLGVLLDYPDRGGAAPDAAARTVILAAGPARRARPDAESAPGRVAVIGAGAFARRTLLPLVAKAGFHLDTVVSSRGTSAGVLARQLGFERASTDLDAVLASPHIDTVFVLTRHDSHAALALRALRAGKHVFVEKPLALTEADLDELELETAASGRLLTVGFNRRFAPHAVRLSAEVADRAGPLSLIITVNAGSIPADHWAHHPELGGGRIIGEGCHFVDLARALAGVPIVRGGTLRARDAGGRAVEDIAHITLGFADGSTAVVHYLSSGARVFPKERIEAFADGRTLVIDNWRRFRDHGARASLRPGFGRQDKGHAAELRAWHEAVTRTGQPPIPLPELFEVSRWAVRLGRGGEGGTAGG